MKRRFLIFALLILFVLSFTQLSYALQYLDTQGIPGIITIEEHTAGHTAELEFHSGSIDDTNHRLKAPAIIDHYANVYSSFEFDNAINVINAERYKQANKDVVYSTGAGNSYMGNLITISRNNPEVYGLPGTTSYWSYIHELTHKIEDDNGDIGYTAGITQYSREYGERNIEYMESVLGNVIPRLELFEADVKRGDFVQAEVRWKAFIKSYEDTIQSKHYAVSGNTLSPDFKLLKDWIGFDIDRHKIEEHYKSGNAGEEFKKFFEGDLGKKITLNSLEIGSYVSIDDIKFNIINPATGYIMLSTNSEDIKGKQSAFTDGADDSEDPYTLRAFLDNWYNNEFPNEQKILVRDFGGKFNKAGVISVADFKQFLEPIGFRVRLPIITSTIYRVTDGSDNLIRVSVYSIHGSSSVSGYATEVWHVAPALILNPATPILSGSGTQDDPHIISGGGKRNFPSDIPGLDFENNPPPELHNNRVVKLRLSDLNAYIGDRKVVLDAVPEVRNGRTFVPLRFIAESLGAQVNYIPNYKGMQAVVVSGKSGGQEDYIIMFIGGTNILHNGASEQIESAPYMSNGRTFVPLRVIGEKLGADISWDGQTKEISISR